MKKSTFEKQRSEIVKAFKVRELELKEGGPGSGRVAVGGHSSHYNAVQNSVRKYGVFRAMDREQSAHAIRSKRSGKSTQPKNTGSSYMRSFQARQAADRKMRGEVVNIFRQREKQLQEYGVPGMKWGERNLPTRLNKIKNSPYVAAGYTDPTKPAWLKKAMAKKSPRGVSAMVRGAAFDKLAFSAKYNLKNAKTAMGKARLKKLFNAASRQSKRLMKVSINSER